MDNQTISGLIMDGTEQEKRFRNMTDAFAKQPDGALHHIKSPLDENKTLQQMLGEMRIGSRIHSELKQQGRSVQWLAKKLGLQRTSLYYIFRQNSIDLELMLRISFCLNYNFVQDVADVYQAQYLNHNLKQDMADFYKTYCL